jgi:FMN phosphatase YigB (HAD superfamily)
MTRAVTFDFWNTLMWEAPGSLREHRLRYWSRALAHVDAGDLAAAHDAAHVRYHACWSSGEQFLVQDAARLMRSLLGGDEGVGEDVLLEGFDEGGRAAAVTPCDGVRECLATLKDAGLAIGIVCDIGLTPSYVVRELLVRHDMAHFFDDAAFSDEVGFYKPAPEIFEHALAGLGGVVPADAAHVGDRQRTDVGGALAAGMRAIRYSAILDEDDPELPQADAVTADLTQIPALLGVAGATVR